MLRADNGAMGEQVGIVFGRVSTCVVNDRIRFCKCANEFDCRESFRNVSTAVHVLAQGSANDPRGAGNGARYKHRPHAHVVRSRCHG